jgi:hypothetical protein
MHSRNRYLKKKIREEKEVDSLRGRGNNRKKRERKRSGAGR